MKKFLNWKLFLFVIVILAGVLRFYQLGNIPAGLTNDEANTGYDAFSILNTGRDQWNTFLPLVSFKGFGDYPPPVYRYLSLIPIYVFGLSEFSIRFVSALFGVLSVITIFFLLKKIFSEKIGLFGAFLFALFPWSVGLSRVAIESNVGITFILLSLFFGLKIKSNKSLIISAFLLGISVYTYSAYLIFAPLVLILILFYNFKSKKNFFELLTPFVVFILIISFIFIFKGSGSVRYSQVGFITNINSIGLVNNLNDQRGQCIKTVKPFICRIINNKTTVFTTIFIKNYFSHLSPNLLYISGTSTQKSILPERGLDYLFAFPLLLFGIFFTFSKNTDKKLSIILLSLFLLSPVADSLTGDGNFSRASMMQPFLIILDALGLVYILSFINENKLLKLASLSLISIIVLFSAFSFYINYLTYFKNNYSIYSQYGYKDLMKQIQNNKKRYDRIYISRHLNDTKQYIYYLLYSNYDPKKFQNKNNVLYSYSSDRWVSIDKIDNIYFVQSLPAFEGNSSLIKEKILLISNPVDFPKPVTPVFVIKDKLGNIIFKAINLSDLIEYNKHNKPL